MAKVTKVAMATKMGINIGNPTKVNESVVVYKDFTYSPFYKPEFKLAKDIQDKVYRHLNSGSFRSSYNYIVNKQQIIADFEMAKIFVDNLKTETVPFYANKQKLGENKSFSKVVKINENGAEYETAEEVSEAVHISNVEIRVNDNVVEGPVAYYLDYNSAEVTTNPEVLRILAEAGINPRELFFVTKRWHFVTKDGFNKKQTVVNEMMSCFNVIKAENTGKKQSTTKK